MDPVGWGLILFRDIETPRFREEPYLAGAGQIYSQNPQGPGFAIWNWLGPEGPVRMLGYKRE